MAAERHRINLSSAWEPPGGVPAAPWTRHFGVPGGLDPDRPTARVWLCFGATPAAVILNGVVLDGMPLEPQAAGAASSRGRVADGDPAPRGRRYDVTSQLRRRNELQLTPAVQAVPAGRGRCDLPDSLGPVWIEIVSAAVGGTA